MLHVSCDEMTRYTAALCAGWVVHHGSNASNAASRVGRYTSDLTLFPVMLNFQGSFCNAMSSRIWYRMGVKDRGVAKAEGISQAGSEGTSTGIRVLRICHHQSHHPCGILVRPQELHKTHAGLRMHGFRCPSKTCLLDHITGLSFRDRLRE